MTSLIDIINQQISNPPSFAFQIGQIVRIKKTITEDTYNIKDLLDKEGVVSDRYCTIITGSKWYNVKIGNRVEPFKEHELDMRYVKKAH